MSHPTQCFSASQIANAFRLKDLKFTLESAEAMHALWLDFFTTVLYRQQLMEDELHPKGCTMFTCEHPWDERCKTKWQEMWQWEDYVWMHYKAPAQAKTLEVELG